MIKYSKTVSFSIYLLVILISSCAIRPLEKEGKGKSRPSEWFYAQRSYPDKTFNVEGYNDALEQVLEAKTLRKMPITGFSAAWTSQGPENIGGRINCVAVHPTDNKTILLGAASGGLFRTADAGATWQSVFDNQSTLAMGDVAFSPSNPNIVFAGTGDPNISAYPFVGSGIYKSTDAGITWTYSGLAETRIISKVIIHPTNPNIVFAAAMGSPFERNEHRGLYKSTDGGATWAKIFYASNQAGVIDMVASVQNPNILYVSAWDRIRTNSESLSSGVSCKVYRTLDGGTTWSNMSGLPNTDNGRIGLAISPTNASIVTAIIAMPDGELKGIYRTTNTGGSWTNIASPVLSQNIYNGMGWYFGKVFISPTGETFALGIGLWRYKNNAWENVTEMLNVHVDMHDMAFSGSAAYLTTDGGAYRSNDNGDTWTDIESLPITQCYHVSVSPHAKGKYWVGTQDNGTIVGNKNKKGDWHTLIGGDGFKVEFVNSNKRTFFVEQQEGNILVTRDSAASFENATLGIAIGDRKAWDMPYMVSPFIGQKCYAGTDKIYRSSLANQLNWQSISIDLTKGVTQNDEQFHLISCIEESKLEEGTVYVGTSDGNAWIYEQNTWFKINDSLPNRFVTSIKASPTRKDNVYIAHSGYKDNSNTPLLHFSKDKGLSWKSIKGNLPDLAINDICILPKQQDTILFVATDAGIYGTKNSGKEWQRLGNNMPYVPVYELELDTANRLLVAATHGRSVMTYPLDSVLYRPPLTANISGVVTLPNGIPLKNVQLLIEYGTQQEVINVDANGTYSLNNRIPIGSKVRISPSRKDNKAVNGVATSDLVAIQKHILATLPLGDAYKILAADGNNSASVTTGDVVLFKKLLLNVIDTLPISWRFVPKSFSFPNPLKPFAAPNFIEIPKLEAVRNDLDFIGIKAGDVNNSASPN